MRLSLVAATALLLAAASASATTTYPAIFVYGDSLSDNGNLYAATGYPPPPYYNGRFSNGPVAPEQLATTLGVAPANFHDFAYGGATTGVGNIGDFGTQTSLGAFGLPGMLAQLQGSAASIPNALVPSSLFIVWGGANDFESLLYPYLPTPTAATLATTAATAAADIDTIVSTLEGEGATHILVPNLPNLGGTPEFAGNPAAILYSNLFNADLSAALAGASGVTLFDTNALFNSILANPGAYGLNNTSSDCLADNAFPSCTGYLFFDDVHPTTAVDTVISNAFANALNPTPEPSSLLLLGTGLLGAVGIVRKRRAR